MYSQGSKNSKNDKKFSYKNLLQKIIKKSMTIRLMRINALICVCIVVKTVIAVHWVGDSPHTADEFITILWIFVISIGFSFAQVDSAVCLIGPDTLIKFSIIMETCDAIHRICQVIWAHEEFWTIFGVSIIAIGFVNAWIFPCECLDDQFLWIFAIF